MKKTSLPLLLFFVLLYVDNAYAYNPEGFRKYINHVQALARKEGVKETTLHEAFRDIKFNHKVVALDSKQPERKKGPGFQEYKNRVVTGKRIAVAKRKLKDNLPLLSKVERKFGVEKEIVVALGGYMGDFDIIRSLTSLAYEGRRREFFEKELIHALKILDQGHVSKRNFRGSWAGAFGQVQFMPSTFVNHAYDLNSDGKKDLWYNNGDAFASAANYLNNIGWTGGIGWGKRVTLPVRFNPGYINSKMPMYKWKQMGLKYADGSWISNNSYKATLIDPDGEYGSRRELYLVTENFDKIKEWNRSNFFATSIGLIADGIKN